MKKKSKTPKIIEPMVGIFKRAVKGKRKELAKTKVMPPPIPNTQEIHAANSDIARRVHSLCLLLQDQRCKVEEGDETESQFEQTSASIHADINKLLMQFKQNRHTDLTDYQLVEAMLLLSNNEAGDEPWMAKEFNSVMANILVDDGNTGSCLQLYSKLEIRDDLFLVPKVEPLWNLFVKPDSYPEMSFIFNRPMYFPQTKKVTEKRIHVESIRHAYEVSFYCCQLFDRCEQMIFQEETEEEFEQVSAVIRDLITCIIADFREGRSTKFTDFEIVEAMILFSTTIVYLPYLSTVLEHVHVDGYAPENEKFREYSRVYELNDDIAINACEDFLWKFFIQPVDES